MLFLSLGTQWRWGPVGPVGLDYQAIGPTAGLVGIETGAELFSDLRAMEAEALKTMGERRKR